MKKTKYLLYIAAFILLILLNPRAQTGIREGIDLCTGSVIPALFPFLIFSFLLSSTNMPSISRIFLPIEYLCGIPKGGVAIFIIGLLGGYPMGAQIIMEKWKNNKISKFHAMRMLGFCSNAGPAFIFGVGTSILPLRSLVIIWLIHIISAMLVGILLPCKSKGSTLLYDSKDITLIAAVEKAVKTMTIICGWILLFRMLISCLGLIIPGNLTELYSMISGILELTNGSFALQNFTVLGARFVLFSFFLSFGGLCVGAQTLSITKDLGAGLYFPGKILQAGISIFLSYVAQGFLLEQNQQIRLSLLQILIVFLALFCAYLFARWKITVAFSKNMMYNNRKVLT